MFQVLRLCVTSPFIAYEAEDIIIGFSPKRKEQQGLGADDKVGLWIGLMCLQKFDCLKLAFFVEEEVGCRGSDKADMEFFRDCRFVIEPDRREANDLITVIRKYQVFNHSITVHASSFRSPIGQ